MQNITLQYTLKSGRIPIGFSPTVEQGFVDLEDVADIARAIALDPLPHKFARYELVGENITYEGIAHTISEVARKEVRCEELTPTEFVARAKASGEVKNEHEEDSLAHLLLYYNRWGLTGNSNTLRWLLGREPTTWEAYLKRELNRVYFS